MTTRGLSWTADRHFACVSLGSSGFTSYCLSAIFRPHATPPFSLMSSAAAWAIAWRSPRMSKAPFPIEPPSEMFVVTILTSVGVTPSELPFVPLHGPVAPALADGDDTLPPVLVPPSATDDLPPGFAAPGFAGAVPEPAPPLAGVLRLAGAVSPVAAVTPLSDRRVTGIRARTTKATTATVPTPAST